MRRNIILALLLSVLFATTSHCGIEQYTTDQLYDFLQLVQEELESREAGEKPVRTIVYADDDVDVYFLHDYFITNQTLFFNLEFHNRTNQRLNFVFWNNFMGVNDWTYIQGFTMTVDAGMSQTWMVQVNTSLTDIRSVDDIEYFVIPLKILEESGEEYVDCVIKKIPTHR